MWRLRCCVPPMLDLLQETWDRIQPDLEVAVGAAAFQAWLARLRPLALERSVCYLEAENRMICDRVQQLYTPLLEERLSLAIGTRIAVHVTPAPESLLPDVLEVSPSTPVVDASNKTAFLVLQSLAAGRCEVPAHLFVFHGPTGVGKSYLLRWWRDATRSRCPLHDGLSLRKAFQLKVRDHRVEQLLDELTAVEVLVVDGIHRFAGHRRAQSELAKALRLRQEAGALTLVTSRFAPRDIREIDAGLSSLLLSGFVTEIRPPGHGARLHFLRALEGAPSRNGRAAAIETMARDLRGSYSDLQQAWTAEHHSLQHHARSNYLRLIDPGREFRRLRDLVCERLGVSDAELMGKSQVRRVSLARQALALLAVRQGLSQAEVGRHLGGRSRASISYAIQAIEKRMAESARIREMVEGLL